MLGMRGGGRPQENEAGRLANPVWGAGGDDRERETHSFLLQFSASNGGIITF
jgi:hypothetical protein